MPNGNPIRIAAALIGLLLGAPLALALAAVVTVAPASVRPFSVVSAGVIVGAVSLVPILWRASGSWPHALGWGFVARRAFGALGFGVLWAIALVGIAAIPFGWGDRNLAFTLMGWEFVVGFWLYLATAGLVYLGRRYHWQVAAEQAALNARQAALVAKLRPHFLFNLLNSIAELISVSPGRAETAVEDLAVLLRRAISQDPAEDVTLRAELDFVEKYLTLEKLRCGDRLRTRTDIEPETLGCPIPPYVLQTLVENAVKHGIGPVPEGGEIEIRSRKLEGRLVITVTDDGCGGDPDPIHDDPGIGLSVTREVLARRYGDDATLTMETTPGKGARAIIGIPCR